ncbi:hypothetical protein SLEP1_g3959 [Rubroshorea leprosula]|uniref:Uncharacterized protein n=1 Tax=Rubroshorea leprosula TaxID=152421 RepID=A0AAV5HMM9_9ROSI|nr:hypothetical protein SLEP1_g3959 [Rubroshorea leprosula]
MLISVHGEQKGKLLTENRDLILKILVIVFIGVYLLGLADTWNDILYAYLLNGCENLCDLNLLFGN